MKKIAFVVVLASSASAVCAADFSLETLKAGDISVKAEAAVVPAPAAPVAAAPKVPQDLVTKFKMVKNELARLNADTARLRPALDRLESTARKIAQTNTADPYFQSDLKTMSWDMKSYDSDAQRIGSEVKNLLTLAQKAAELNDIARDLDWDARVTLLNRAQVEIKPAAQRLEWTVRGAKPEIIGYDAQWVAMDISRYSQDFTGKVGDISSDTQVLVSKTQP